MLIMKRTTNDTFSLTITAEVISNYGEDVFISVSVTTKNTKSILILILKLIVF